MIKAVAGTIPVDPKELRVNLRFLSNGTLPPSVREAMKQTRETVERHADEQGWEVANGKDRYGAQFQFTMNDLRADLDGPLKRGMDAITSGLKINDGRIDEIHLRRAVGEPSIKYVVWVLGNEEDEFFLIPGESFVYGGKS